MVIGDDFVCPIMDRQRKPPRTLHSSKIVRIIISCIDKQIRLPIVPLFAKIGGTTATTTPVVLIAERAILLTKRRRKLGSELQILLILPYLRQKHSEEVSTDARNERNLRIMETATRNFDVVYPMNNLIPKILR
jgi:hypothetical protein